jgi:hypothetical protein
MATYKTGWIKKFVNGVSTKLFAFAHVKTVYYDYANKKTLYTKLSEMDTSISGKSASNHTHDNFVKSGSGAKAGFVPKPSTTAGTTKYLREDGTWTVPPDTNTTYSDATTSSHGLMSVADKYKLNGIANAADFAGMKHSKAVNGGTANISLVNGHFYLVAVSQCDFDRHEDGLVLVTCDINNKFTYTIIGNNDITLSISISGKTLSLSIPSGHNGGRYKVFDMYRDS